LTSVTLPNALDAIYYYAFYGCTGLTSMTLPDSITKLSASAFEKCTNLASVNIPKSWTTLLGTNNGTNWSDGNNVYTSPFVGCTKLTTLTVPEGITTLPKHAFRKHTTLKTVTLPSTLTEIGAYAFDGCTKLKYIALIDGLETIGSYAFRNCTNLESLYLPHTVTAYGDNVLQNCPKLVVECTEYSFATIYCIDSDIPVEFIGDVYAEEPHYLLDREATYYVGNTVGAMANGYVTMNLAYGFKSGKSVPESAALQIRLPEEMRLIQKTLTINGELITDFTYEDDLITIPVTEASSSLAFCVRPVGDSTLTTYAVMDMGTHREILGIINEFIPLLSIQMNDEVNSDSVIVTGIAPANTNVTITVDGASAVTTKANALGSYRTFVKLTDPQEYRSYTLTAAAAAADGSTITASKTIQYCSGTPVLQSCTMEFRNRFFDLTELGLSKPIVTFESDGKFAFDVKFSNPEKIETVYICSTRSNVVKRMEAKWNEATKSFYASGFFDPEDRNYVPGPITVQYKPVEEKLSFENGVDYTADRYVNNVSEPIKAVLNGKAKDFVEYVQSDGKIEGTVTLPTIDSALDFNILTDVIPSYLDEGNAGRYGYEVMEDDYGAKLYLKVAEMGEDHVRGEILDFANEEIVEFFIKGGRGDIAAGVDSAFAFSEALGYANKLIKWDNNNTSLEEARKAVLASSMSSEEKAAALQKLEYAEKSNNGVIAAMGLQIILTAAGIAIPFPASMILPLLSMKNSAYVDDVLSQFGFLDAKETEGVEFLFRWKIDPSGYVYDASTGDRLPGVTATAYWIPNDYSEDFFANPPADDVYGTLWDAAEWDQANPLITDAEGRYAWDVPEGWWRVKYEKQGYDTVWSHWMTVPPVQENVNIGMTANGEALAPDYQFKLISSAAGTATVSIRNNTAAALQAKYILAAYDEDGKMIASQVRTGTIASAAEISQTVTFSTTAKVEEIRAFLIDSATLMPLRANWSHSY
ncbi:MAG: leucine-rich repeat domain-containing protein, partial [Butyricicoccus sp.]|nr:leucine-rich repeat domain-containing protein [Butyricicoccus sp.]